MSSVRETESVRERFKNSRHKKNKLPAEEVGCTVKSCLSPYPKYSLRTRIFLIDPVI